jgi:uncharacterized protein YegL
LILLFPFGLGLLVLAGVIIALHARRKRVVAVPGLLIWRRVQARSALTRATLRLPPLSLPLLLQLAALAALAAALAQPVIGPNNDTVHWVHVVEAGETADGRMADLDKALADIGALIDPAVASRHTLILADDPPRPIFARQTAGDLDLSRLADTVTPSGRDADWDATLALAAQVIRPDERTALIVMSGRHVAGLPEAGGMLEVLEAPLALGPPRQLREAVVTEADDGRWQLSGRLATGAEQPARIELTFTPDGNRPAELLGVLDAAPSAFSLDVGAAEGAGILAVIARFADGGVERRDLVVTETPRRILYVGPPDAAMQAALAAVPSMALTHAATLPPNAADYDLVVIDGVPTGPLPQTNMLLIGVPAAPLGEPATPDAWDERHPLARDINWRNLEVQRRIDLPAGPAPVAMSGRPLLLAETVESGLVVRLGFRPEDSNWARDPALAVFATNLVDMLGSSQSGRLTTPCIVGSPCRVDPRFAGGLVSDGAGGEPAPIETERNSFTPQRAGLYTISRGDRMMAIAVHPLPVLAASELAPFAETAALPERPIALWPLLAGLGAALLAADLALAVWSRRPQAMAAKAAQGPLPLTSLGLRLLAIGALALAMFGINFAMPRSDSASIAIVSAPNDLPVGVDGLSVANGDTDFARPFDAQLALGAALLPMDRPGRLILDAAAGVPTGATRLRLDAAGVPLDLLAQQTAADSAEDAGVRLIVPPLSQAGRAQTVTASIAATGPLAATGRLAAGDETLWTGPLQLETGTTRLDLPVPALEAGSQPLRFELVALADMQAINDVASLVLDVRQPQPVAVIARDAAQGEAFARLLDQQGLFATVIPPAEAPETLEDWRRYGAAALIDVPAIDLATTRQIALDAAVSAEGLGLLILGGPNSFGPGGYLETPLDKLSPISARIPRDRPGVALVFVLDRSSSMREAVGAVTRLDIAKQATLAAIGQLPPESEVAVVTFDSAARVAVPLTSVGDADFITRMVGQISLGGGTALYRGLTAGFNQLRSTSASARHVVVMTDGQSQPADYGALIAAMSDAGVTISSVAIGAESERELLETLAREGGGLFHATTDFAALPSILSQEAMMLASDPIELGTTQPVWMDWSAPVLEGLPDTLPSIEGLVLATAKPDADLHLSVRDRFGEMVPLLASWRYGNGQVMALTTDVLGPWTQDWQRRADYPLLFVNALDAFAAEPQNDAVSIDLSRQGDEIVALVKGSEEPVGPLAVTGPDGAPVHVDLRRHAEGWVARYQPVLAGIYSVALPEGRGPATASIAMDYPSRFAVDRATPDAADVSGRQLAGWQEADAPPAWRLAIFYLPPAWLGLALALFLLDLTIRYSGRARPLPSAPRPTNRNTDA